MSANAARLPTYDFDLCFDAKGEREDAEHMADHAAYELWAADRSESEQLQSYADFLLAQQMFDAWEAWDKANNASSWKVQP